MSAAADEVHVPGAARLEHGQTARLELVFQGRAREAFVLMYEGVPRAYLNECPHWAVELDLGDGHFFDEAAERVYCKNHGALFHPETGVCETGPCLGRSLVRLRLRVDAEDAWVDANGAFI